MHKRLGLGDPKLIRMSVTLPDKNVRNPKGIVEDFLIKVKDLVFPVDFVILNMEKDINFPLILVCPFCILLWP